MQSPAPETSDAPRLGTSKFDGTLAAFERVSLNLAALCGAIPLDNFLANDYDDSIELDYREFEREDGTNRDVAQGSSPETSEDEGDEEDGDELALASMDVDSEAVAVSGGDLSASTVADCRLIGGQSSLAAPALSSESASTSDHRLTTAASRTERDAALEKLHKACKRLSGTVEALHFEFIEEDPSTIQCILTVTIPTPSGNARRSYSTTPTFGKRFEAKGEAAAIAVSMGVLDFLKSALSPITHSKDKIDLLAQASENPLDDGKVNMVAGEQAMEEIELLCEEWRPGGTVQPEYIPFRLGKNNQELGCALRLALTSHAMRIYSSSPEYSNFDQARAACALVALEEGIREYIMYGNGQKFKPVKASSTSEGSRRAHVVPPLHKQLSLQEFFDTLPRPFVETIDENKGVYEHQWSGRLNIIIQGAKLHTCRASYHFSSSGTKNSLTGCVLRIVITHPPILSALGFSGRKELVKTYVVDPHFVKSNDAKIAVGIVAVTQNVRGYLAGISKTYEEKTQSTREFDRTTSENFVKVVGKLLMRLDPGRKILFDYFGSGVPVKAKVGGDNPIGYGCSFRVDIAPKDGVFDIRTFSVPAQYPSKLEAKTAAILDAAKAGLVELLRYPAGTEPPEGYVSYWDTLSKHESYDVYSSGGDTDDEDPGKTKAKKKLKRKRKAEKKKADKQASGVPVAANAAPDEATSEKQTVTTMTTQVESEDESGEISDSPPPVQVQEKQPQRPQKKKRKVPQIRTDHRPHTHTHHPVSPLTGRQTYHSHPPLPSSYPVGAECSVQILSGMVPGTNELTKSSMLAAEYSWRVDYIGGVAKALWRYLSGLDASVTNLYARYASIVQSSGTGKSRAVDELSRTRFVIPINLRAPGTTGYPPPDGDLERFLCQTSGRSQQDRYRLFCAFLQALFRTTVCALNNDLDLDSSGDRFMDSDPPEEIARKFRNHMSFGMSANGHGVYRIGFYEKVVQLTKEILGSDFKPPSPNLSAPTPTPTKTSTPSSNPNDPIPTGTETGTSSETPKQTKTASATQTQTEAQCALQELVDRLMKAVSKTPKHRHPNPIVTIAFDEAQTLTGAVVRTNEPVWSNFTELRRALRHHISNPSLLALFLSTTGKIDEFASSGPRDYSARFYLGNFSAYRPFVLLGFDQLAKRLKFDGTEDFSLVTTIEFIASYGRPLWGTIFSSTDPSANEIKHSIVQYGAMKLLGGRAISNITDLDKEQKFACLSQRLPIEFNSTSYIAQSQEQQQVEGHMRICMKVDAGFESMITISPSEPLLSEAAYYTMCHFQMDCPAAFKGILNGFSVHKGDRGEMLVLLFQMMARDQAVSPSKSRLYVGPGCSCTVPGFLKALFEPKQKEILSAQGMDLTAQRFEQSRESLEATFKDSTIYCTHWLKLHQDKIVSTHYLVRLFARGAAVLCGNNHSDIDGVMPYLYKGTTLAASNIGAILWQSKNDEKYGNNPQVDLFTSMDPYSTGLFDEPTDIPVIRIVFALAAKEPSIEIVTT
ncbi:hypothetical protein EST38_g11087, partial [Candolleomyces aberdarensis]